VSECLITKANVKIKPGTAIGVFGDYGIGVSGTATIDCQGAPENMNQIVSYNLVQEQLNAKWIGTSKLVAAPLNPKSEKARIYFRFTDFSLSARRGWHLYGFSRATQPIIMKDCQFHNGYIYSARPSLQFTNCLFERVYFALDGWGIPMDTALWNNTFYGGIFEYDSTESGKWNIHNNVFDDTTIINYGKTSNLIHSCNAYLNSCATNNNRLLPASPNDVIVSRFGFLKGPLGRYYSGTNSPLLNAGSLANAGDIGLYHYTIRQDQVKEANSRLDIGFHYVPMDLSTVADIVWWDDAFPPGSMLHADYEDWQWISKNPYPYSGKSNHISQAVSGLHQHFFEATLPGFRITPLPGDTLFCYAYIDPENPPTELMIQWRDPSYSGWWRHRVYWGNENILLPGIYMGPLPLEGGWVRLEVPACSINAEGKELFGMAFTLYNGRVAWDYSGISRKLTPLKPFDTDEDGLPDWFEDTNGNGRFDKTDLSDFKTTDTNGNGINDGDEFKSGKDPKSLDKRDKRR
ncbi:MAG TPA: hypothetical protein PLW02_11285, partial [Verrucomicrobiota bacterium]|nr:hypothetical protein [Verrucomicrobiota bacterium]